MARTRFVSWVFIVFALIVTQPALAQAQDAEKQAAVERYLSAVPMSKMMDDTYMELAKQMPLEKRAQFIADMREGEVMPPLMEEVQRAAQEIKSKTAQFRLTNGGSGRVRDKAPSANVGARAASTLEVV